MSAGRPQASPGGMPLVPVGPCLRPWGLRKWGPGLSPLLSFPLKKGLIIKELFARCPLASDAREPRVWIRMAHRVEVDGWAQDVFS